MRCLHEISLPGLRELGRRGDQKVLRVREWTTPENQGLLDMAGLSTMETYRDYGSTHKALIRLGPRVGSQSEHTQSDP